jgi:Na+(H+)/acetate symporter ActP
MSVSGWFILTLAVSLANFPFTTRRFFGVITLRNGKTSLFYILEFVLMYMILASAAYALEAREGRVFDQGWQFYVITVSLLMVFSFPGFVIRFLLPRTLLRR